MDTALVAQTDDSQDETIALSEKEELSSYVWRDVFVIFWKGRTNNELIDILEGDVLRARQILSNDYAVLVMITGRNRVSPDPEARRRLINVVKSGPSRLKATAIVIDSSGFDAATSRGIVVSLKTAREKERFKAFNNPDEAIKWLTETLGRDQRFFQQLSDKVSILRTK